jgi:putative peptide zinc metalloprotease protein
MEQTEDEWSIWETLEKRGNEVEEGLNIWTTIKEKLDISKKRPERIESFELKKFEHKGKTYYIIKNIETNKFLRMSEEDYFVWEKLDGENTIRDIALSYFLTYKSMGFANIGVLISRLGAGGFLKEKSVDALSLLQRKFAEKKAMNKLKLGIYRLIHANIQIHDVDKKMKRWYERFFWIFYTKLFIVFSLLVIGIGGFLFYRTIGIVPDDFSRFDIVTIIGFYLIVSVSIIIHELAHGFTTTHFGREVGGFGLMFYYGGIAAFCDTTDIWMAPRSSRFLVSFVGPYSNFIIGSSLGILAYFSIGDSLVTSILLKAALMNYVLGIFNLNPLLEWDGYYMLMDYFEIPNMRKRSFRFLRENLIEKIKGSESFNFEEKIMTIYGITALIYTTAMILFIPIKYFNNVRSFIGM